MPRKLRSLAAFLVLLAALAAGPARTLPLAADGGTSGLFVQLWQWTTSSLVWIKAGGDMDPNGKHPRSPQPIPRPDGPPGPRGIPAKAGGDMDPNG